METSAQNRPWRPRQARFWLTGVQLGLVSIAPRDIAPLLAAFEADDLPAAARVELIQTLAVLGRAEAFETVAAACRDAQPRVRAAAALALGSVDEARATDTLLACLADPEAQVRAAAARALAATAAESGPTTAVIQALCPLLDDAQDETAGAAAWALATLGSPEALAQLDCFRRNPSPHRRAIAIGALETAMASSAAAREAALAALADEAEPVRLAALQALHAADGLHVEARLLDLLHDAQPRVRAATAALLAHQMRGPWSPVLVERFAQESDVETRYRIAQALGRHAPPGAAEVLLDYLATDGRAPLVTLAAVEALGALRDARASAVLAELASSADRELALAAASALELLASG